MFDDIFSILQNRPMGPIDLTIIKVYEYRITRWG